MIKVRAEIKFFKNSGRTNPIITGYRPLFDFNGGSLVSGRITLIKSKFIYPEEREVVYIEFLDLRFLGDNFRVGTNFKFGEGVSSFGEGKIIEIISRGDR